MIFLLISGGPTNSNFYSVGSTDLLVTWLYNLTVTTMDYNLASVIGILIFIYMQKFIYYRKKKVEFFSFLYLFFG
ncbi:sugar ABC transporter permease [Enterococcus faecium]|uniref:sugar ABC transporter permease n=1 Tax=Enterococcus faecium TaxID=1352 RepID=UPI000A35995A|nr:sugar ABC transporter permease [Enterococcus faecium]